MFERRKTMLKKVIKYHDFDGVEREEEFYFNLSKAALAEMEISINGGLSETLRRIIAAQDGKSIMELFKTILKKSYGVKTADGRKFEQSDEIWLDFYQTEAYNIFFMELVTDADKAVNFIKAILPPKQSSSLKPL